MSVKWVVVDIQHVTRSDWRGFIPAYEILFSATSESLIKSEARRLIEETTGLRDFEIVWNQC